MKQFEFAVPNGKVRLYNRFAVFLFLLSDLAIGWFLTVGMISSARINFGIATIFINLVTVSIYLAGRGLHKKDLFVLSMIVLVIFWSLTVYWWVAIIIAVLAFLYFISQRNFIITISEKQIVYPSFPKRLISWNELTNLVLKDGWLTIDFLNNRIIQHEVVGNGEVSEADFNEFCRSRLVEMNSNRSRL
jgi:hypothetical protein